MLLREWTLASTLTTTMTTQKTDKQVSPYHQPPPPQPNKVLLPGGHLSPLAALIAPLAGLALMGAAASVAVNPLLLKLVAIIIVITNSISFEPHTINKQHCSSSRNL